MKLASSPGQRQSQTLTLTLTHTSSAARGGWRTSTAAALLGLLALSAAAQQQPASELAPALAPKATAIAKPVSRAASQAAAQAAAAKAAAASAPVPTAAPAVRASIGVPGVAAAASAPTPGPVAGERADRADLDRTQIIGNRELPKVLYIVPWKRPVSGAMERPVKSIIDEVFAPLDRDVLRRQVRYEAQVRTAGEAAMEAAAATPTMPTK